MKPLLVSLAAFLIVASFALANAEEISADNAGKSSINPDSIFWGIENALDRISLALKFNDKAKAEKGLEIARERLFEFEKMAKEGKIDSAKKAKESHDDFILRAKSAAKGIRDDNKTREIEQQIEIEREVGEQEDRIGKTKIKIKTEGNLTAEQKALIETLIASMQNQTGSLKIEIKQNKEKIKIEIKQKSNKTEIEIENEIEEIEERHNISGSKNEIKSGKALEEINDAKEELAKLEAKIAANNATDNAVLVLRGNAKSKLSEAESAYASSKYGEAYGLANAAGNLAENARKKIGKLAEKKENNGSGDKSKRSVVELCETENPGFNASAECKKIISEKYADLGCSFELGPVSWLPQGSCRNCTIECKAAKKQKEQNKEEESEPRVCIQVITPAKNKTTGECREFPTPCDVPKGWEKVEQCSRASLDGETKTFWIEDAFELFTEARQNEAECKARNISIVMGGCFLENIIYDRSYLSKLENRMAQTGCWEKAVHRFMGIKKGETQVVLTGTCDYKNKVYTIKIKA